MAYLSYYLELLDRHLGCPNKSGGRGRWVSWKYPVFDAQRISWKEVGVTDGSQMNLKEEVFTLLLECWELSRRTPLGKVHGQFAEI